MENKRRHKRFTIEAIDVRNKVILFKPINVIDIGVYGLACKIDKKLEPRIHYTLNLRGKRKTVSLKGIVARSSGHSQVVNPRGKKRPLYTVGFQFVDMTTEQINELIHFINEHTHKDYSLRKLNKLDGLRLSVRIPIRNPVKDILNYVESHTIKNLSYGGILIEAKQKVEPGTSHLMEIVVPKQKPIKIVGEIIRCSVVGHVDTHLFQIGIAFIDISERDRKRIKEIIHSIGEIEDLNSH